MADQDVKYPKPNKSRKPPVRNEGGGGDDGAGGESAGATDGNWKGPALIGAAVLVMLFAWYVSNHEAARQRELTTSQFYELIGEKVEGKPAINQLTFERDPSTRISYMEGTYRTGKKDPEGREIVEPFRTVVDLEFENDLQKRLEANGLRDITNVKIIDRWWAPLVGFLPFVIILVVLYFLFRQQLRMAGKNAFSFGKSRARMMNRDRNKVTFKDVAGIDEAREELSEIVEFLKDPRKFQKLGGRIPKGVLMIGPPGTGKTLLAKAIAGEADVPFFSISGSDFVEMFVGVGASRVRDMFEQGKKSAPCLIFIDEIDAVGRSRGTGLGGGHDEREQTLNALLVEMDGIETTEGVIIIAATNRKDVLDPALLRPGRFDREVRVNLPDVKGRQQILQVHTRNVKLSKVVDLGLIARGTPGFSGAELANLVNEAALLAARRGKNEVEQEELEEARDKVRWGRERRSMAMTEEEKRDTAVHEAGHALLTVLLPHTDPLHKVSIIPRGPALGVTMYLPEKDRYTTWRRELLDRLVVIMGGRVAEELFLGDVSNGASNDIYQATWYARKMVCEWGMSDKLGMVQYGDDSSMNFLGRELGYSRSYSETTAQEIDQEVLRLVNDAHKRAKELIGAHRDQIEKITAALLEYETLDGKHIVDIIKYGEMKTPPPKPLAPTTNPNPKEPLPVKPKPEPAKDEGGMLPGLQGAPAGA
jgi:cell division protease FtsH